MKLKKKAVDYETCANCFGCISASVLRRHWNQCTANSLRRERIVKVLGRAVEGRLHAVACDELRTLIFPFMRKDECVQVISFDWLIITFGNDLCLNYSPVYQHDLIRKKLREAGKLLIAAKSICNEITDFESLFHVKKCNTVIETILKVARFDCKMKTFQSPSTAATTVTLVNAIAELLLVETMKPDNPEKETIVTRFSTVFQKEARVKINKIVAVAKEKSIRDRNENIPSTEDITTLAEYLDSERDLSRSYSDDKWKYLSEPLN